MSIVFDVLCIVADLTENADAGTVIIHKIDNETVMYITTLESHLSNA